MDRHLSMPAEAFHQSPHLYRAKHRHGHNSYKEKIAILIVIVDIFAICVPNIAMVFKTSIWMILM